jgi:nanoRNase/pAp phosphatase (c-di-AMP/oligoRNAs hydrolase)
MNVDEAALAALLPLLRGRKALVVHGNADPDALGSAFALQQAFPDADIVAPGGLDRIAKIMAAKLGITVLETADHSAYDLLLAVDTSSPDQIGAFYQPGMWAVIDHHAKTERWNGAIQVIDERSKSCAEVVLGILDRVGYVPDRRVCLALLSGILTDTGHFRYANSSSLRAFASLVERGGLDMDEAMNLTDVEQDTSERVAQMKGAQRLRFERIGDVIVAGSMGSSFEASVCKTLLQIGADISFVVSQRDEQFRISARARPEMVRAGLHLGRMLTEIGGETSSDGGGHPGAAGMVGVGDAEAMLNICMHNAMNFARTLKKA